jgi:ABC-2 type transport system permease protein
MLRNSFAKWLRDNRRSVITWTAAIAGVGGMYAAFWPTIDNPQMRQALESYPEEVMEALNYTDIATPAGYLNATVYGLIVALLIVVYSISAGARTIAGDEEAGLLDLILAHPVTRARVALQRFAAFLVSVVLIGIVLLVVLLALAGPARLEGISVGDYAAMHLHLTLFAGFFGSLAFAVGAATGRRSLAIGAGAGIAVFGFAANGVLPQVEGLEWIKRYSPFDWLNGNAPLQNGVELGSVLIMAVLIVVLVAAGTWAFNRRDVAV